MTVRQLKDIFANLSEEDQDVSIVIRQHGAELQYARNAKMGAEYMISSVYSDKGPDKVFVISSDR